MRATLLILMPYFCFRTRYQTVTISKRSLPHLAQTSRAAHARDTRAEPPKRRISSRTRPVGSEIVTATRCASLFGAGKSIIWHTAANARPRSTGHTIGRSGSIKCSMRSDLRKFGSSDINISSRLRHADSKGMHRSTYERLTAELYGAMKVHDEIFEIGAASLLAHG
jgi:hypothetical protein